MQFLLLQQGDALANTSLVFDTEWDARPCGWRIRNENLGNARKQSRDGVRVLKTRRDLREANVVRKRMEFCDVRFGCNHDDPLSC